MVDLDKLEAIARAAQEFARVQLTHWRADEIGRIDDEPLAEHVEAFSPDVVLGLIARTKVAEAAALYLFNAWGGAEGEGQPANAVFGDSDMDPQYARFGAPPEIQDLMRRLLG